MLQKARVKAFAVALGATVLLSGCAPDAPAEPQSSPTHEAPATDAPRETEAADAAPDKPAATSNSRDADIATATFGTSWRDALAIGAERVGGEPVSVQFRWDGSQWIYVVKYLSADSVYIGQINADTGAIVREKTEQRGGRGHAGTPTGVFPADGVIEPGAAVKTALGVASGSFDSWHLEREDGVLAYEVELETGGDDVDVTINATTGAVMKIEN